MQEDRKPSDKASQNPKKSHLEEEKDKNELTYVQ